MPELGDFHLGAQVVGTDGRTVGTLVSVLVEANGFEPKALVVKDETRLVGRLIAAEKLLVTDEVVVPISAVESATRERVQLSIPAEEVRQLRPYLSYRLGQPSAPALLREAELLGGGLGMPNVEEVADKSATEIEIDRDENVMIGTTGHRLGKVQDVLTDNGELVGIVVRPDGLFKHDVVLPIKLIARGDDLALFAGIDEEEAKGLKPFSEPD